MSKSEIRKKEIEMGEEVVVLDYWPSMFGMRIRIALAEKGIKYEAREEDLRNKSELLLKMNPVHKKIPVLIHNGKPVCESSIALEYIDEVWNHLSPPLLPSHPYDRSQARFWVDFIDKKLYGAGRTIWTTTGDEQQAGKSELITILKLLEESLGDKPFFGGESFGYLDIALIGYYSWFQSYETFGNFSTETECPKFVSWANRCLLRDSVSQSLPSSDKVFEFVSMLRDKFGIA